jgi:hypothetical protein
MDAFELAAQELGITRAEVERAVKVYTVYRKHRNRLKEMRYLAGVEALNRKQLAEAKIKYPDKCFCIEEGIDVKRDWKNDKIVRYEKVPEFFPFSYTKTGRLNDDPVYVCSNCSKEYRVVVAMA